MIDLTYQKLQHLMNLLRSMEELNDLRPKGPLTPQRVRYPINTTPTCEPHSPGQASQTLRPYQVNLRNDKIR
jgi:hypothetical protein